MHRHCSRELYHESGRLGRQQHPLVRHSKAAPMVVAFADLPHPHLAQSTPASQPTEQAVCSINASNACLHSPVPPPLGGLHPPTLPVQAALPRRIHRAPVQRNCPPTCLRPSRPTPWHPLAPPNPTSPNTPAPGQAALHRRIQRLVTRLRLLGHLRPKVLHRLVPNLRKPLLPGIAVAAPPVILQGRLLTRHRHIDACATPTARATHAVLPSTCLLAIRLHFRCLRLTC